MNQLMITLCIGRHQVTVIMKILKCLHNVCQLKISGKDMNRTNFVPLTRSGQPAHPCSYLPGVC